MSNSKKNIYHGQFIKTDKGLLVAISSCFPKYKEFVNGLQVGQTVEIFMESNVDSKTVPQLAKVHACIRELAKEVGYSFEDMKLEIKKKAGLCVVKEMGGEKFMICKSFSDCSVDELGLAITAIIEVGETVGINFN